jgi:transposase
MDNDRPPIIHVISRETGEERCPLAGYSDKATCQGILAEAVPHDATMVYSDEYRSYHGLDLPHADDDGDGVREVHCNTCEGTGAGLRSGVRPFRGVHKAYLQ